MGKTLFDFSIFLIAMVAFVYLSKREAWGKNWSNARRWTLAASLSFLFVFVIAPVWIEFTKKHSGSKITASSISNEDDARKFLRGTWTFTEQLDPNDPYMAEWEKWTFKDDGTVDVYSARPVDDNWGVPKNLLYEVHTAKYTDTGKRYYYLNLAGSFVGAVILDDDLLGYKISASSVAPMHRGEKNPFSK